MTTGMEPRADVRTYGGWRRARGLGLFGVGPVGTVVVLGCVLVPLLLASFSFRVALLVAAPAALLAALVVIRVDDTTAAEWAGARLRWEWALFTGQPAFRGGTVLEHEAARALPGPLNATRLLSVEDGRGGRYGLVWDRQRGTLTATLSCAATSTWLVEVSDADGWVGNWHGWLASLGYLPIVRAVAVTVETAPEPGTALRERVLPLVNDTAPDDARALLTALVRSAPTASADVATRVSIVFDPARASGRVSPEEAVADVTRTLAGLESSLASCGVTVLGRASAVDLACLVRAAYDPARRGDLASPSAEQDLDWSDAGPVAASEAWDRYRHDSGWSVSWAWREAPRQQVTSAVLSRLLSPGRFPKRVTLLFRPLPAGEAARVLEAQVNAAVFRDAYRRAQKRDETARDAADRARAQRAAAEEAQGAGVLLMSLWATATVADESLLEEAVADVEARADQSKVRLRRRYGDQAAAFAVTLPCGVVPS